MTRLSPPATGRWRNFYHLTVTDSTNEEAARFIAKGISSGIVAADRQTAGRGRGDKAWHSPAGKNLYVSFFERTNPDRALDAAKAAGLAAYDTVAFFLPAAPVFLKWPNDILVGRRKLCGILIQHLTRGRDLFTVTGIGLNIETPPKDAFPWQWEPTSLEEASGKSLSPDAVFRRLVSDLARWSGAAAELDGAFADRVGWMLGAAIEWRDGAGGHRGTVARFADRGRRIVVVTTAGEE